LRQPNLAEVAAKWNIQVPPSIELLFQNVMVEESEFYLRPPGSDSSIAWYIEHFIPFTANDLSEWLKITGVPGLPIAVDGSKGVYYLPFDDLHLGKPPRVLFQSPGKKPPEQVALTIENFLRLEPVEMPEPLHL
jgi:hypothetical protein